MQMGSRLDTRRSGMVFSEGGRCSWPWKLLWEGREHSVAWFGAVYGDAMVYLHGFAVRVMSGGNENGIAPCLAFCDYRRGVMGH
jgi:hypothetical protein